MLTGIPIERVTEVVRGVTVETDVGSGTIVNAARFSSGSILFASPVNPAELITFYPVVRTGTSGDALTPGYNASGGAITLTIPAADRVVTIPPDVFGWGAFALSVPTTPFTATVVLKS